MIYTIKCDGYTLHNPRIMDDTMVLNNIKLNLEINAAGSLSFDIEQNHYYYDHIFIFKSVIDVYRDSECIWRGRVIADPETFSRKKTISCEGALAFLNDVQYPASSVRTTASINYHLSHLLDIYNANIASNKKIYIGNVVTGESQQSNISFDPYDYMSCMDRLSKILDAIGGYVSLRITNGVAYLDYNYDIPERQEKTIRFGINLIDLKREAKIENFANAIIPRGCLVNENDDITRLDISSLPDGQIADTPYTKSGLYILDTDSISIFGRIETSKIYDDVNLAYVLRDMGCNELYDISAMPIEIETQFIDMNYIDPTNEPINLLDSAIVLSPNHAYIDGETIPILAMELDLNNPSNNKYTVSKSRSLSMIEYILGL